VREAIDFCRYYAAQAREKFSEPILLPGPTGERNSLSLHGRGVFVCISPWNFPLAIFVGQIAAALAAGNTVVAKPAEQTPLVAALAVELLHAAGIPPKRWPSCRAMAASARRWSPAASVPASPSPVPPRSRA
jgi:RHH-type proline utilization regulon transcriptional repressor/proline dehydrogenase/delta 1-pyrroline-5-carboxylate dehydrogenase